MSKTIETAIEISGVLSPSLQSSIKTAIDDLDKLQKTTLESASASEKFAAEIKTQESVLKDLKTGYAGYVLSGDQSSEAAQELAKNIEDVSAELENNKATMKLAYAEADKLADGMEDAGQAAEESAEGYTIFKDVVADLASNAIQSAISSIKDLVSNTIELGQTYTSTMSEVQAISGASAEDMEMLNEVAREYGATTVFSAAEAGEALKYMSLAGWDANTSASALGGVLNLAAASGMELGAASDMVTDYLSAFGMAADESAYFADLLAFAQSNSNTTAEALGEAYKNCAATLNAAGQDVETVTSLLEGMANQGLKGSTAGTAMAAIMRDITDKMEEGAIAIGETSVAVTDAQGNFRDLTDIMKDIDSATNGLGTAEKAAALSTTFTSKSLQGLNLVLNEGVDKVAGYEEALRGAGNVAEDDFGNAIGAAENMAAIMNDNLTGDLANMNSAWEEFQLKIYEKAEPALRSIVQFATEKAIPAAEWAMNHIPEIAMVLASLGGVLAAFNVGKVVSTMNKLKGVFSGLGSALTGALGSVSIPILAAVAAISVLAFAFKNLWENNEEFRDKITEIWSGIQNTFSAFGDGILERLNALGFDFENFRQVVSTAWDWLCEHLIPVFESTFQFLADLLGPALDVLTGLFDVFTGLFTGNWDTAWNGIQETFSGTWDFITTLLDGALSGIQSLLDGFLSFFDTSWGEVWEGLTTGLSGIWEGVTGIVSGGISGIGDAIGGAVDFISTPFSNIWETCTETASTAVDTISTITAPIGDAIGSAMDGATVAWDGLTNVAASVDAEVENIKAKVAEGFNSVMALFDNAKANLTAAVDTILAGFSVSIPAGIMSIVEVVGNLLSQGLSNAITIVGNAIGLSDQSIATIRATVVNGFESIYASVANSLEATLSTATAVFGNVKNAITNAINGARTAVTTAVSSIRAAMNFSWSLPKLKLPHLTISGSFSLTPPSVPKFGIQWYAEGGIMNRPTMFGMNGMDAMIGGEAGAEAILPLNALWDHLETIISSAFNSVADLIIGGQDASIVSQAGKLINMDDFSLGSMVNENNARAVYYDFSNFHWNPQIDMSGDNEKREDIMTELRAHEAEFFDWLNSFIAIREVSEY